MRRLLQFTSLRLHPHRTYSNPRCSSSLAIAIPGSLDKWWRRSSDELRLLTRVVERGAVQALSAQYMFRVVHHLTAESGILAREYGMLTLCTEYHNPKKLNFYFWSFDTRTTGYRNGRIKPFPTSAVIARRQRTSIECSWVSTYVRPWRFWILLIYSLDLSIFDDG